MYSPGTLGGALKRKEKLSARLGDVLSQLYLCSATLWRFEHEGRQAQDAPVMHWAIWDSMLKAQNALEGVINNFPNPLLGALMRRIVFPLGRPYVAPPDDLGHAVAKLVIEPSATRERLTAGMFIGDPGQPVGMLERALGLTLACEPIERKLKDALRRGRIDGRLAPGEGPAVLDARAVAAGVISESEAALLADQREIVAQIVRVDDFEQDLGTSLLVPHDQGQAAQAAARPTTAPAMRRAVA